MYVLGIETSCDETSASIVRDGREVFSNVVSSSLKFHRLYGGVVPEIASRMQLESITQVVDAALKEAGISLSKVNLVSVTNGPGLVGSLLVGIGFAKAISFARDIPLLGVNHIPSHIYANFLNVDRAPKLPFIALVISGGHTSLFHVEDFDKMKLLGSTLDDACGEAFDKVAKILGLGYPGGPLIEKLAKRGNTRKFKFLCSNTKKPLDFSFSGIKTAVLYQAKSSNSIPKADIAASFQEAAIDTLIKKSLLACKLKRINRLAVGGGVAANNKLREKFSAQMKAKDIACYFPSREFSMDNAAMVAGLGWQLFKKGCKSNLYLNVN